MTNRLLLYVLIAAVLAVGVAALNVFRGVGFDVPALAAVGDPPTISDTDQQKLNAALDNVARVTREAQQMARTAELMVRNAELEARLVAQQIARPGYELQQDPQTRRWSYVAAKKSP